MHRFCPAIMAVAVVMLVSASSVRAQGRSDGLTPLQEAARFLPGEARTLSLTDWAQIRAVHDLEDITSDSPIEERVAMIDTLKRVEPLMLDFGQGGFQLFADTFGWDVTDLDWQADANLVDVLRFREGKDLDAVAQRLLDHGFQERSYRGVRFLWQSIEDYYAANQTWQDKLPRHLESMAFLPDGRTVLSGIVSDEYPWFEATIDAYLDGAPQYFENQAIDRVVGRLGRPMAAEVRAGACAWLRPRYPTATESALISGPPPLGKWHAMGAATYRTEADAPATATLTFDYPPDLAAWAEQDRAGRVALVKDQPTATFAYVSDLVEGGALVIHVTPTSDQPHRVLLAIIRRQAPFAACA